MEPIKLERNDITDRPDWRTICSGPPPTNQPEKVPDFDHPLARQHRIAAAERFMAEILEGIQLIAHERRILRRAVEWVNTDMGGNKSLATVLGLTTPVGRDD